MMNRIEQFFVIDLFAGCGGLSEGFKQAGFEVIAQVEMNKWACETLGTLHLYYELKKIKKIHYYNNYLKEEISKEEIFDKLPEIREMISLRVVEAELRRSESKAIFEKLKKILKYHDTDRFHVVIGGPPCQPYSLAGKARRNFEKTGKDPRHFLYRYYLEFLEWIKPDIFIYENVPGLITTMAKGREIFRHLLEDFQALKPSYGITPPLDQLYDNPASYILNGADFGVPQNRKRIILIGYRKDLLRKNSRIEKIFEEIQKKANQRRRRGRLTVDDAIGDLPPLQPGEGNDSWLGPYNNSSDLKSYQIKMRKNSPGVLNHRARTHMESDRERYRFFIEHHMNGNGAATLNDLMEKRPDLIPNHRHLDKFLDRFKVQWWNRPSSTITAHICKDGHYYIHPDIHQCRSFTVREAARCQSFPDSFKFEGPRTEQFRQVGNAVPPLLARSIGRFVFKELKKIYE